MGNGTAPHRLLRRATRCAPRPCIGLYDTCSKASTASSRRSRHQRLRYTLPCTQSASQRRKPSGDGCPGNRLSSRRVSLPDPALLAAKPRLNQGSRLGGLRSWPSRHDCCREAALSIVAVRPRRKAGPFSFGLAKKWPHPERYGAGSAICRRWGNALNPGPYSPPMSTTWVCGRDGVSVRDILLFFKSAPVNVRSRNLRSPSKYRASGTWAAEKTKARSRRAGLFPHSPSLKPHTGAGLLPLVSPVQH